MQLFYAPAITLPRYTLPEEESRHCVRVLRLGAGDPLHLTDGRGNLYRCEVEEPDARRCVVRVRETLADYGRLPYRLTMAVAPTKHIERFEWFLEKATEVGIEAVVPLDCERSERRILKPEREQKVLIAAMKQSLKACLPTLHPLTPLREVLERPFAGRRFIAHCGAPVRRKGYLPDLLHRGEEALVLIGPEGDFSPEEVALAVERGFEEITLGDQRLRTETAAVAATVMVSVVNSLHE